MTRRDFRRLSRAENIIIFYKSNHADTDAFPAVDEGMKRIGTSMVIIIGARADQAPNRITKSSLLDALLLDFKRIAGTARSIALRDGEIGFAVPFLQVPQRIEKDIRTRADSLLKLLEDNDAPVDEGGDSPQQKAAKEILRGRFTALGVAPAFVSQLREDRNELDQVNEHNRTEVQEGTEDTALISRELAKINTEVDILGPIMSNIYEFQPEKLHAWKRASRVERDPRRSKADPTEEPPTPPTA